MPHAASSYLTALLATARLTGVVGLAITAPACKKTMDAPEVPLAAEAAQPADNPADATAAEPVSAADQSASDEELAACRTLFEEEGLTAMTYDDFGKRERGGEPAEASDAARACCDLVPTTDFSYPRWGCCAVSTTVDRIACTPWGPPAPPPMLATVDATPAHHQA